MARDRPPPCAARPRGRTLVSMTEPSGSVTPVTTERELCFGGMRIPWGRFVLLRRCLLGSAVLVVCSLSLGLVAMASRTAAICLGAVAVLAGCWSLYWLQRLIAFRFAELESAGH